MKILILMSMLLSLPIFANDCQEAIKINNQAIEEFGANTLTANTGMMAYQACKEELDEEGKALATLIEIRCFKRLAGDGTMYMSFRAQCALDGVKLLSRESENY